MGGPDAATGRLEVQYKGQWGTICRDGFSNMTAVVACRQLGYVTGLPVYASQGKFAPGTGSIFMDDLYCPDGNEPMLSNCFAKRWGDHNCLHEDDVGVMCTNTPEAENGAVRTMVGYNGMPGQLEVYWNGIWGTVSNYNFDNVEAQVACRQMGKPWGYANITAPQFSQWGTCLYDIPVHWTNMKCSGTESRLDQCPRGPMYSNSHSFDAGMVCSEGE